MAKNMSFQREYAEPYDWVAQQFKDWAFTLTTSILYYNDYDSICLLYTSYILTILLLYQPSLASSRAAFFFLGFVLFSLRITASLPMVCSSASYSFINSR